MLCRCGYYHRLTNLTSPLFSRHRLRSFDSREASSEQPVIADLARGEIGKLPRMRSIYRCYAGAEDFWGDEECDSIYDAGGEGGTGQLCAAFDQDVAPSAAAEFARQVVEREFSGACVYRDCFDAGAFIFSSRAR